MDVSFSMGITGTLFTLMGQPITDASAKAVAELAREGESLVRSKLYFGHGRLSGDYQSGVTHKFVRSSQRSVGWGKAFGGKERQRRIIGRWLEGVSRRNQTTRFKGYMIYRQSKQELRAKAKSIAERYYQDAIRTLNS